MTVVIVKPGYAPYEAEINGLDEMQEVVGGMIQAIYPFEDIKSQILCAGPRVFRSENLYCKILNEKEKNIYD